MVMTSTTTVLIVALKLFIEMTDEMKEALSKCKLRSRSCADNRTRHYRSAISGFSLLTVCVLVMSVATNVAAAKDDEIIQRLAKIERALDNRGLLDLLQRLESLQAEVQTLRGQLEEQQYTIERLRQSQREAYVDLDRRMQESLLNRPSMGTADTLGEPPLTVFQPGESPDVAGTPAPDIAVRTQQAPPLTQDASPLGMEANKIAEATETGVAGLPDQSTDPSFAGQEGGLTNEPQLTADQAYREAFGLLKAGKYDESIEAFNLFLLDHPNSEYADNAQYWLGETYFVKQEYTSAIDEYRKLITNFPASKKQSHALLKIGYSYQRLGELDNAQAVLKDLQTRYPGTTAARLAAERIQQILAGAP